VAKLVLDVSGILVGEKVQVELAGRPEQEKVSVPLTVLEGVMKIVTSVVEPWATATSGRPLTVWG
jgi:hypothetical protein